MEQFEEHMADTAASFGIAVNESTEFLDSDFQESDEFGSNPEDRGADSVSVDDPVRVYLKEMGSVRLLTRQGEIDLARRMERGTKRIQKASSRSPLVCHRVLAMYEDVRKGKTCLE